MTLFKETPDFAVRKINGTFVATLTLNGGVAHWDYGDGRALEVTNVPNISYTGTTPPYLINLIDTETGYFDKIVSILMPSQFLNSVDISRFPALAVLDVSDNVLNSNDIEHILTTLDANGVEGGTLDYSGNFGQNDSMSIDSRTSYDNLIAKGWSITGVKPLEAFIITVKTDNNGTSNDDQFRIPINNYGGGTFDAYYDGTSTLGLTTENTLTFPSGAGTYDIVLIPNNYIGSFKFQSGTFGGDREKITDVKQWGQDWQWASSSERAFNPCINLQVSARDIPNFDLCTGSNGCDEFFDGCSSMTYIDVTNWTFGTATSLVNFFEGCNSLVSIDGLDTWDTSLINTIGAMFNGCYSLQDLSGIENWDTTNITNIGSAFTNCTQITKLDLSAWNVNNVTNCSYAFSSCTNLVDLNVSTWVLPNCSTISNMFESCSLLETLVFPFQSTTPTILVSSAFRSCVKLTSIDISTWCASGAVITSLNRTFNFCYELTSIVGLNTLDTSLCTNMSETFSSCRVLTSIDLSSINTSNVTSFTNCFNSCYLLTTIDTTGFDFSSATSLAGMFSACISLTSIDCSNYVGSFNTSSMFSTCSVLTTITFPVTGMVVTGSCISMFVNCKLLTTLTNFKNIDFSACTTVQSMFQDCDALVTIDLSGMNFSSCNDFYRMFHICSALTSVDMTGMLIGNSSVRLKEMFYSVPLLTEVVGLGGVDITQVDDMLNMFLGATLNTANYDSILTGWDAQAVLNNINFHGGNSQYSVGAPTTARANLIADHSWTITDGGQV